MKVLRPAGLLWPTPLSQAALKGGLLPLLSWQGALLCTLPLYFVLFGFYLGVAAETQH